jgi:hypothetical protein
MNSGHKTEKLSGFFVIFVHTSLILMLLVAGQLQFISSFNLMLNVTDLNSVQDISLN